MRRLRILVSSLYAPYPPYGGGGMRTMQCLKTIGAKHQVTFLGTYDPNSEDLSSRRDHLTNFCEHVELVADSSTAVPWGRLELLREIVTYPPAQLTRFVNAQYVQTAFELLNNAPYDLVICNTVLPGQIFAWQRVRVPKILDVVDILEILRKRDLDLTPQWRLTWLYKYADWRKTAIYERHVWRHFDALIASSEKDAETLRKACPKKPIATIPLGIPIPAKESHSDKKKNYDLLLIGRWDYPPNVDALEYFHSAILPLLHVPLPRVAIVGKNPTQRVEEIAQSRKTYSLFPNVPDVIPFYRDARIAVIPLRTGSGVKVKVLEALAHGLPVVTTSVGAEGISIRNGEHALIADDAVTFANSITRLLNDPSLAHSMATRGRNLIRQEYNWENIQNLYLNFVEEFAITSCSQDSERRMG